MRVYSLESSQNLSPDFTIITFTDHWKRPHSYKLSFLDYGIHKEARFRKVKISSQLPINAGWSAAHVEPYFKVSPQLWKLAQFRDLNSGPSDLESFTLPPGPRIPLIHYSFIHYLYYY